METNERHQHSSGMGGRTQARRSSRTDFYWTIQIPRLDIYFNLRLESLLTK